MFWVQVYCKVEYYEGGKDMTIFLALLNKTSKLNGTICRLQLPSKTKDTIFWPLSAEWHCLSVPSIIFPFSIAKVISKVTLRLVKPENSLFRESRGLMKKTAVCCVKGACFVGPSIHPNPLPKRFCSIVVSLGDGIMVLVNLLRGLEHPYSCCKSYAAYS